MDKLPEGLFVFLALPFVVGLILLIQWLLRQSAGLPSTGSIAGYLVDPNTTLEHIFVVPWAIVQEYGSGPWIVYGKVGYTERASGTSNIKLVRSGTGFRVYGHPELTEGKWLPCR